MQAGAFFLERKRGRGKIFFKKSCLKGTFERNINTIVKKTWYTIPDILIETKKRDDIGENRFDFRLDRLDWNPELDRLSKAGLPGLCADGAQQLEAAGAADPAVPSPLCGLDRPAGGKGAQRPGAGHRHRGAERDGGGPADSGGPAAGYGSQRDDGRGRTAADGDSHRGGQQRRSGQ